MVYLTCHSVLERTASVIEDTIEDNDAAGLYIKLPAHSAVDCSGFITTLTEFHQEAFEKIFPSDGETLFDHCLEINLAVIEGADQVSKAAEKVQRNLSIDEAEKLLLTFRGMANLFPFVVISESDTVESMSRHSPFLLLAILTSASFDDAQLHQGLDQEFKRILGSEIIAMGKKSLDFLTGILVYTSW